MRTDLIIFFGVIIVDIVLVLEIMYFIIRRTVINRLIQAAFEKNDGKFDSIAKSFFAKFVSGYDKELVKFNVASLQKDNGKIEESIQRFEKMELRDGQKKKLYPRIFYHYIDRNRKQEAKKYYEELSRLGVYRSRKDVEMTYDAYVLEGHGYLDEALELLKKAKPEELPTLEKAISKMYENKKINSEAKKYERLAQRHQRELESRQRR
ncbi:MAG: hypothetical protein J5796_01820 [Erysipelotrichaceae bacterium]|nr:hypothetical protein [Erysipelotrichaceae bacterium]